MTQCERILEHLQKYGSITRGEAYTLYGVARLASRISDLKKDGYKITVKMETGTNRYGEKTHFAKYTLNPCDQK